MSKQPRSLVRVIDALCKVAPDLTEHFRWLRNHVAYTPPETMRDNWAMAMQILQENASEHPQQEKLAMIFGDKIDLDEILGPEEEPYVIGECGGPDIVVR